MMQENGILPHPAPPISQIEESPEPHIFPSSSSSTEVEGQDPVDK